MEPLSKSILARSLRKSSRVLTLFAWPILTFLHASEIDPAPTVTRQSAWSSCVLLMISTTSSKSLTNQCVNEELRLPMWSDSDFGSYEFVFEDGKCGDDIHFVRRQGERFGDNEENSRNIEFL